MVERIRLVCDCCGVEECNAKRWLEHVAKAQGFDSDEKALIARGVQWRVDNAPIGCKKAKQMQENEI